ncbi:MAG: hypothetical protein Q8930_06565 [Bacillota bacterium]|nr:hypothetical protein [Bacillota bacterium]
MIVIRIPTNFINSSLGIFSMVFVSGGSSKSAPPKLAAPDIADAINFL